MTHEALQFQLDRHKISSLGSIARLTNAEVETQLLRLQQVIENQAMMQTFELAQKYLVGRITRTLSNHVLKALKRDLLQAISSDNESSYYSALIEKLDASNSYGVVMRNFFGDRSKFNISVKELFGIFDDISSTAKLVQAIQNDSWEYFVAATKFTNITKEILATKFNGKYNGILKSKQDIVDDNLQSLPQSLQQLETANPGIIARFVTLLVSTDSEKELLLLCTSSLHMRQI
jgi:hypothetical protein